MLKVLKFGGTSVEDLEAFDQASNNVLDNSGQVVVVLSAMSGVTNQLISTMDQLEELTKSKRHESADSETSITDMLRIEEKGITLIDTLMQSLESRHFNVLDKAVTDPGINSEIKERLGPIFRRLRRILSGILYIEELNQKSRDLVVSFGERLSCTVMEGVLRAKGGKAKALRSGKVGILTDSVFGNSSPLMEETTKNLQKTLMPILNDGVIPVITGYFGVDKEGNVTTFGRGGSDFSAAIIGAALHADWVEIWTDVDGFYSADPSQVKGSHILRNLDYEEAAELAYFGAKVLHPRTIEPLRKLGIPIVIKNTFKPDDPGSTITTHTQTNGQTATGKIRMRSVAAKGGLAIIKISGDIAYQPFFTSKVHSVLDEMNISVFAISTSLASFSFLIEQEKVDECLNRLKMVPNLDFDTITVYREVALICVVGHDIEERIGIAAQIFTTVAEHEVNIRMISEGTSDVAINFVIDERQKEAAVTAIHNEYCKE